ncbi:polyketide antibiotic transporter [Microbacterium sp. lyk4-40-TSB-66]|uniref:ABC transporter permease n=1 Tax=Microbacterium sp. lyk4-40-TSB-66 TaxID=3040294 RepID=UPI00254C1B1B|nr:polyketide antibiotic transporter [Microbacterium sp. lyk4-40-TSB-66]
MNGLGPLLRVRLRRDAVQLAIWILGTVALGAATVAGVRGQFATPTDREALLATAIANPVILLFRGLPSGSDEGAFAAFLITPFLALLAALMSTFLAVRHTRGDEEAGRAELVAATPAGRSAALTATVAHGILANLVLAVLAALTFVGLGFAATGSALLGASAGLTGVAFLAVAFVAAEIARTARAANSIGVWAVLLSYLACGVGNALGTPSADLQRMQSAPLAWASPFGWAENVRAFDADDARPLLLSAALAIVAVGVAVVLHRSRDLGASLLPAPRGPATAGRLLSGPIGLAWRESRGAVIGWVVAGLLVGLLSTRLSAVISQIGDSIPSVQTLLQSLAAQGSLAQGAVEVFFTLAGILAACAGVQAVVRLRQDEAAGLAEPVRAAGVSRVRWLAAAVCVALAGIVGTLGAAVTGAALGVATTDGGDTSLLRAAAVSAAGQALAALVITLVAAVAVVVVPRASIAIGWGLVGLAAVAGLFGPLLGLPDAVVRASPLASVPILSGDTVDARGAVWWALIAAALITAATVGVRRRPLVADR